MAETTTPSGVTIAHSVTGSGPPLLLIHGLTESHRSWDPLVPALAAGHTVAAVDLPGHGGSGPVPSYDPMTMAAEVAAAADALGLDRPLVVGHSLGGVVAAAYAAAHPCRGLLVVDQPLALAGFQDALRPLEPALRGDTATFTATVTAVLDAMAEPLAGEERARIDALRRPDQEVVLAVWAPVLESSPEDLDALVGAIGGQVTVPFLSLHGTDPGEGYAGWLASVAPGAAVEVEVWPGTGHYPHLLHPDRFLARLAAFEAALTG